MESRCMMSRLCVYELCPSAVRSLFSFTRWFYHTHARSLTPLSFSLQPAKLHIPSVLDAPPHRKRTLRTHGDARGTSASTSGVPKQWYILCSPAPVSSAFPLPRLVSLVEEAVSAPSPPFHHVLRASSPRLPYVLPTSLTSRAPIVTTRSS
jgi:hypothetical protein